MSEKALKKVSIPVASHGLHNHPFNYPYFGTSRFMEVFPVFYEPLRIGEKSSPRAGVFSILQPLVHNAFVTGRYHFKGVFVPYTFIYRPWYHLQRGIKYQKSDGTMFSPSQAPNTTHGALSEAFVMNNKFVSSVNNPSQSAPYNWDIKFYISANNFSYFKLTNLGARVLKILNGLGVSPSWIKNDSESICLLNVLAYVKAYADIYFPGQYVGTKAYSDLIHCIRPEEHSYTLLADVNDVLVSLGMCSQMFYDRSMFDYCWDTPSGPNSAAINKLTVKDQTFASVPSWDSSVATQISNDHDVDDVTVSPSNGAFIANPVAFPQEDSFYGRVTKFGLQALESIANFMRRNQLAGSRLIDNFLAERGIHLGNMDAQQTFVLGDKYVEIDIQAVENNSNTNLGELAGRGRANTDPNAPLTFECEADHDGVFIVFLSVEPDCDSPVYNDAFNSRVYQYDFYHAAFDKLGVEGVRQIGPFCTMNGETNKLGQNKLFGFLNRYYGDIQEKPRLCGDFRINTRGAAELSRYHTMRLYDLSTVLTADGLFHSYDFVNSTNDLEQYKRLFYDEEVGDGLLLYIRWFGSNRKEKLPLGDSFDWDDDEFNKRVTIVNQGMKG